MGLKVRLFPGTGALDDALTTEQSKEIFANFGLAVHASNVVEFAVLNALCTVELLAQIKSFRNREEWESAYDTFFEIGFAQTFGRLVRRIKDCGKYSTELVEMLESCQTARNHLVHHSQREGAEAIYSSSGRAALVETYENAVTLFDATNEQIEKEIVEQQSAIGIDTSRFADRVEELMQELVSVANP
jgi:hypothetical protein